MATALALSACGERPTRPPRSGDSAGDMRTGGFLLSHPGRSCRAVWAPGAGARGATACPADLAPGDRDRPRRRSSAPGTGGEPGRTPPADAAALRALYLPGSAAGRPRRRAAPRYYRPRACAWSACTTQLLDRARPSVGSAGRRGPAGDRPGRRRGRRRAGAPASALPASARPARVGDPRPTRTVGWVVAAVRRPAAG